MWAGGRWGRKRANVGQCWAAITAESLYGRTRFGARAVSFSVALAVEVGDPPVCSCLRRRTPVPALLGTETMKANPGATVRGRSGRTSGAVVTGLATAASLSGTCSSPTLPSQTIIIPPPAVSCPVAPSPVGTANGLGQFWSVDIQVSGD